MSDRVEDVLGDGPEGTRADRNKRIQIVNAALDALKDEGIPAIIVFQVPWNPDVDDLMVTTLASIANYRDELIFLGKFLETENLVAIKATTTEVGNA